MPIVHVDRFGIVPGIQGFPNTVVAIVDHKYIIEVNGMVTILPRLVDNDWAFCVVLQV